MLRLPVIASLRIGREFLIGNRLPLLSNSVYGQQISRIAQEIASFHVGKRPRTILVTGLEESFSKSVFAANLAYMMAGDRGSSILVAADPLTADAVTSFSEMVEFELGAERGKTAVGAEGFSAVSDGSIHLLRVSPANNTQNLLSRAQMQRIKEKISSRNLGSALVVIDAPLLDEQLPVSDLAALADEVVVVLPEGLKADQVDFSSFRKLGGKRERIRGVVTVDYA